MLLSVDIKYQKHRFANSTMGVGCKKILSDSRQRRDSNFEILRIIAMMMVILQHIAVYGGWPMDINQTFDWGSTPSSFNLSIILAKSGFGYSFS